MRAAVLTAAAEDVAAEAAWLPRFRTAWQAFASSSSSSSPSSSSLNSSLNSSSSSSNNASADLAPLEGDDASFFKVVHAWEEGEVQQRLAGHDLAAEPAWRAFVLAVLRLHVLAVMPLLAPALLQTLYAAVATRVDAVCAGDVDGDARLPELRCWLDETVMPFLDMVLLPPRAADDHGRQEGGTAKGSAADALAPMRARLVFFLHHCVAAARIGKIFEIIRDFPDSQPAMADLQACLAKTSQQADLVQSLLGALRKRLLHPGASTADIVTTYISAIKVLRILDPSGVTLQVVSRPICEYLRGRSDAIRCIVTMLTEDTSSELFHLLGKVNNAGLDSPWLHDNEEDDEEDGEWQPVPVDADLTAEAAARKTGDIVKLLINIYGGKELFVNEYRLMMADKMLAYLDYETDREIRTMELLKLRFGETSLHYCEIMLKDLAEAKRVNTNIQSNVAAENEPNAETVRSLDCKILSRLYWPSYKGEEMNLPAEMERALETYNAHYERLKTPRKLCWLKQLGTVELELEMDDGRVLDFAVTPFQAAAIHLFAERQTWSLKDLAKALGVAEAVVRKRIAFWSAQGILREERTPEGTSFVLIATAEEQAAADTGACGDDDENDAPSAAEVQASEENKVYESLIIGLLTNFKTAPLDRIHNTLKMCCTDPPYTMSSTQLSAFLQTLVNREAIDYADGVFALKK